MSIFITILTMPIILLNTVGGFVGAGWLLYLGHWRELVMGIAAIIAGPLLISIALLPGIALIFPMSSAAEKGNTAAVTAVAILSYAITAIVMVAWVLAAFIFFMSQSDRESFYPFLLWSYAVATGPWVYIAQIEMRSDPHSYAPISSLFLALSCLALMVGISLFDVDLHWRNMLVWLIPFMVIGGVFQIFNAFAVTSSHRR